MCDYEMKASEFSPLLKLAREAMGNGPKKWEAHSELMEWFRSGNCEEVILALQAAARVVECPGGRNNSALVKSIHALKPISHGLNITG